MQSRVGTSGRERRGATEAARLLQNTLSKVSHFSDVDDLGCLSPKGYMTRRREDILDSRRREREQTFAAQTKEASARATTDGPGGSAVQPSRISRVHARREPNERGPGSEPEKPPLSGSSKTCRTKSASAYSRPKGPGSEEMAVRSPETSKPQVPLPTPAMIPVTFELLQNDGSKQALCIEQKRLGPHAGSLDVRLRLQSGCFIDR
jgi:hypothetical protein